MGRSLCNSAIGHGDKVLAIGQQFQDNLDSMQTWYPTTPATHYAAALCDVRIRSSVDTVVGRALSHFGGIDVIAICHGYGVIGACEDQDESEIRNQFETNFMGTLNIVQSSLAYFREREHGRYLIFSSTAGALGVPGMGPYCATKYAVEGLVESMLYEVDQFNIKLTLVIGGHMRRDDSALPTSPGLHRHDASLHGAHTASGKKYGHFRVLRPSAHYSAPDSPSSHAQRMLQWIGDNQPTSAVKAAELVWQLGHCSYPPLRMLLGSFAVDSIRDRLKSITEEIEDWKELHFPPIEGMEGIDEGDDGDANEDAADERVRQAEHRGDEMDMNGSGGGGVTLEAEDSEQG